MSLSRLNPGFLLALILLVALAVRLVAAVGIQSFVNRTSGRLCLIEGDAQGYWELARRIAAGESYEVYDPPRRVMRMPGFPLLLAVAWKLRPDQPLVARCLLAILSALGCGLVYLLARRFSSPEISLGAAAAAAVSPSFIVFSVLLLSETIFAVSLLLSLLLMVECWQVVTAKTHDGGLQRIFGRSLAAGLGIALATYLRPTWILAGPVFLGLILLRGFWPTAIQPDAAIERSRLWIRYGLAAAVCGIGVALPLAPWTIRNAQVTGGHFIPTTLWVGASLYDGLNPKATGASDMTFFEADRFLQTESEYDVDQHYRRLAWQFVRENPGRALQLGWIKLQRYFAIWPNTDQFADLRIRLIIAAWSIPLLGLALVGVVHHWRNLPLLLVTAGPLLYFAAVHAVFVGSLRYRLPAEYPLLVLSALGGHDLYQAWCHRRGSPDHGPP